MHSTMASSAASTALGKYGELVPQTGIAVTRPRGELSAFRAARHLPSMFSQSIYKRKYRVSDVLGNGTKQSHGPSVKQSCYESTRIDQPCLATCDFAP